MDLKNTVKLSVMIFVIYTVVIVKSENECEAHQEELQVTTLTPSLNDNATDRTVKIKKDYVGRPRPDQKSLLIVFDATGSMATDLAQLRKGAQEIVNKLAAQAENPIYNYILSVFRDPTVEPVLNTRQPSELLSELSEITVNGGGDCPELALLGLKNALDQALPNSLAFVFSDASAKDFSLHDDVVSVIQKKQIKVNFLLTGVCSDGKSAPGFAVYEKLSRASGGQVFDMKRDSVKDVLLAISTAMDSKFVSLKSLDSDTAGQSNTSVKVDDSFSKLSVSLSGDNATLTVTDRENKPTKALNSFTSDNIKFIEFEKADNLYTIQASADSPYSMRVGGVSDLKFDFGFSTKAPGSIDETSIQPLVGQKNVLSIFASDPKLIKCLYRASIFPANINENFAQIDLPLNRTENGFYASQPFDIPNKMFKIQVSGYDNKGNPIERQISIGVQAVTGSPPEIHIDYDSLDVNQHSRFELNCIVKSLTPVKVSWMLDSSVQSRRSAEQSTSLPLIINSFDQENVGKYICTAENDLGHDTKDISTTMKLAPIVMVVPDQIQVKDGDTGRLVCEIRNADGPLKISWIDEHGVEQPSDNAVYEFTATTDHHNKILTCVVRNGDFLVSNISFISVKPKTLKDKVLNIYGKMSAPFRSKRS